MNYAEQGHELAATIVEDKYGIIPLANDLLLAVHYAELSSTNFDDEEARRNDVTTNLAVADALSQFELSVASLSKDLGGSLIHDDEVTTTDNKAREDAIEELDTSFKSLFGKVDTYTRGELLTSVATFGTQVNAFTQSYGDDYRDELTNLGKELTQLETAIDDPATLGHVRVDGGEWQRATLNDYVEFVQARIHDLYI